MNDPRDPLEDKLRQFQPRSVSAAKRQQMAERISATPTTRHVVTSFRVLAAAVAACLLVGIYFFADALSPVPHTADHHPVPEQNDRVQVADAKMPSEQLAPTLWTYRRAADASLEELDSLLMRHSQELLTRENGSMVSLQQRFP